MPANGVEVGDGVAAAGGRMARGCWHGVPDGEKSLEKGRSGSGRRSAAKRFTAKEFGAESFGLERLPRP
jgi:hypothetical protein